MKVSCLKTAASIKNKTMGEKKIEKANPLERHLLTRYLLTSSPNECSGLGF